MKHFLDTLIQKSCFSNEDEYLLGWKIQLIGYNKFTGGYSPLQNQTCHHEDAAVRTVLKRETVAAVRNLFRRDVGVGIIY